MQGIILFRKLNGVGGGFGTVLGVVTDVSEVDAGPQVLTRETWMCTSQVPVRSQQEKWLQLENRTTRLLEGYEANQLCVQ